MRFTRGTDHQSLPPLSQASGNSTEDSRSLGAVGLIHRTLHLFQRELWWGVANNTEGTAFRLVTSRQHQLHCLPRRKLNRMQKLWCRTTSLSVVAHLSFVEVGHDWIRLGQLRARPGGGMPVSKADGRLESRWITRSRSRLVDKGVSFASRVALTGPDKFCCFCF